MKLRLKELREGANLTQKQMAEKLNCGQTGYSNYELGLRDVPNETLCLLADIFKVSTDYLLGRTDNPKPPAKPKE